MKAGWQAKSFEDCIDKVTYTSKIQRKDFLDVGDYPIVSQEDAFINGYWDNEDDVFQIKKPVVLFGDHTKVLKYVDFDFVLGADGVKILPPKEFLVPKFFYYQLQTAQLDSLGYARHYKLLKELEIKYPGASEQQRVVAILDAAFAEIATAKATAEKNLQNARALFEGYLNKVFTERGTGWIECPLEEAVTDECTLSYGIVQPGDDYPLGLPVVRPTDLVTKTIELEGLKRIDPKLADGYKRTRLKGGELLLCVRGSTGVMSIASQALAGGNVTRGIVPISFDSTKLGQEFGYFIMLSEFVQAQIREKTYGTALMQINIGDLRRISIAYPQAAVQKMLVGKLEALFVETRRLEFIYQQKLAALDELKKSLLHQVFSGQL